MLLTDHQLKLLSALTEGKTLQDTSNAGWVDVRPDIALRIIAGGGQYLRVKSPTINIAGKEYDAPIKGPGYNISIARAGEGHILTFQSRENANAVFQALVRLFTGSD